MPTIATWNSPEGCGSVRARRPYGRQASAVADLRTAADARPHGAAARRFRPMLPPSGVLPNISRSGASMIRRPSWHFAGQRPPYFVAAYVQCP